MGTQVDSCSMLRWRRAPHACSAAGMLSRDITEYKGGRDAGAGTGIRAAKHGRRCIAGRIQTLDDGPITAPYSREFVSNQAARRADIARIHGDRIKRRLFNGSQVGIGLDGRIAMRAVKRAAAAPVLQIAARLAEFVEPADAGQQTRAVDTADPRKLLERAGALQIAAVEPRLGNCSRCRRAPRIKLALPAVHDQPAWDGFARPGVALIHPLADFHVGPRLV